MEIFLLFQGLFEAIGSLITILDSIAALIAPWLALWPW